MQLPGIVYTALIVGGYAALQALSQGFEEMGDQLWVPVAVALVAAALKALEAYREQAQPRARTIGEMPRGFWSRFLLG